MDNKVTFDRVVEFAAFCAVLTRERIAFTAWQREVEGRDEAYMVTITGEVSEEGSDEH